MDNTTSASRKPDPTGAVFFDCMTAEADFFLKNPVFPQQGKPLLSQPQGFCGTVFRRSEGVD